MSEPVKNPGADGPDSSDEYGFDPERDPLDKDEEQAEASEYGLYGYSDQAGQAMEEQEEIHCKGRESEATAKARRQRQGADEGVKEAEGGQDWNETEHGAGYAQPLDEPQRSGSRSSHPSDS